MFDHFKPECIQIFPVSLRQGNKTQGEFSGIINIHIVRPLHRFFRQLTEERGITDIIDPGPVRFVFQRIDNGGGRGIDKGEGPERAVGVFFCPFSAVYI